MHPTDERDFHAFASTAVPALLPVAHALTGGQAAAERLLTTTLARVARRWHRLDDDDPTGYATRTLFREYAARRAAAAPLELQSLDDPEQTVRRLRHAALRQLAPRERTLLVLRFLLDHPEPEAAELVGTSTQAVREGTAEALARVRSLRTSLDDTADLDVEAEVRQTLRELADATEPASLGPAALVTARRQRYTRLGAIAAAALALVGVVGGLGVVVLRTDPPPPDLDGRVVVTSYHDGTSWFVLDPDTGEYRFGFEAGIVSPDLRSAFHTRWTNDFGTEYLLTSTTDRDTSVAIEAPAPAFYAAWSPDGARITSLLWAFDESGLTRDEPVLAVDESAANRRIAVVEVATRRAQVIELELAEDRAGSGPPAPFWLDSGRLAVPTGDAGAYLAPPRSGADESFVDAVGVFDLTGALVEELPINTDDVEASDEPHTGLAWRPYGVLPDRRWMLVRNPTLTTMELAVVDLATDPGPYRAVTLTLPEPPQAMVWQTYDIDPIGTAVLVAAVLTPANPRGVDAATGGEGDLVAYVVDPDSGEAEPVDLAAALPETVDADAVTYATFGDAAGLSPDAAHLAFVP